MFKKNLQNYVSELKELNSCKIIFIFIKYFAKNRDEKIKYFKFYKIIKIQFIYFNLIDSNTN
jgi:hypothetical protein